jgi:hypothetical protein
VTTTTSSKRSRVSSQASGSRLKAELVPTGLVLSEHNGRPESHYTVEYDGNNFRPELAFHRRNVAADLELLGVLIAEEDALLAVDCEVSGTYSTC